MHSSVSEHGNGGPPSQKFISSIMQYKEQISNMRTYLRDLEGQDKENEQQTREIEQQRRENEKQRRAAPKVSNKQ